MTALLTAEPRATVPAMILVLIAAWTAVSALKDIVRGLGRHAARHRKGGAA